MIGGQRHDERYARASSSSIANPSPSAELAELLIAMTSGLRVAARAGRSAAQMRQLIAMTLGVLDTA